MSITVDYGWYAERQRAMLAAAVEALGAVAALVEEHPDGFAPEILARLDAIARAHRQTLEQHHDATASDFTRCPVCGTKEHA